MATREDLLRAGMDGFDIVEKYFVRRGWPAVTQKKPSAPKRHAPQASGCLYQYQPQQNPIYQVNPAPDYEVVLFGDGGSIKDYSTRKPAAVLY